MSLRLRDTMKTTSTRIPLLLALLFCLLAGLLLLFLFGLRGDMMARGAEDYSNARSYAPLHRLDDMAELAARLGSVDVYDRRGNVIWWDDFNKGRRAWSIGTYGTGGEIVVSPSYPKFPPFCLKVTGGSDGQHAAQAAQYISPHELSPVGFEVSTAFLTSFDSLYLTIFRYDGTELHEATVRLDDDDDTVDYRDSDGNYQKLDDLPDVVSAYGMYHSLKLVADLDTDKYVRFLFNQNAYDLSDYDMRVATDTSAPKIVVRFLFYSRTGNNDNCRLDGVIITQNEPLEP